MVKDLSKGSPKFWELVSKELNSLGPPTKDGSGWKKVIYLFFACDSKVTEIARVMGHKVGTISQFIQKYSSADFRLLL